jgi:hypothetical protein
VGDEASGADGEDVDAGDDLGSASNEGESDSSELELDCAAAAAGWLRATRAHTLVLLAGLKQLVQRRWTAPPPRAHAAAEEAVGEVLASLEGLGAFEALRDTGVNASSNADEGAGAGASARRARAPPAFGAPREASRGGSGAGGGGGSGDALRESAQAFLVAHAAGIFAGLRDADRLAAGARAAVVAAASELASAFAALDAFAALLRGEDESASGEAVRGFVEQLRGGKVGHLCRPFLDALPVKGPVEGRV